MIVTVRAARPDVAVPREGSRRRPITHDQPVVVQLTPYYKRQIADGDLIVVTVTVTAITAAESTP